MSRQKPEVTMVLVTETQKIVKECYSAPHIDYEVCDEVVKAFAGMLIDAGWMPESVYRAMRDEGDEMMDYYNRKDDTIEELKEEVNTLKYRLKGLAEEKEECEAAPKHYGRGHQHHGNNGQFGNGGGQFGKCNI